MMHEWLAQRASQSLHPFQLQALISVQRKLFSDFELQGVPQDTLESKVYQSIAQRLQVEEATQSVKMNSSPVAGSSNSVSSAQNAVSNLTSKLTSGLNLGSISPRGGFNLLSQVGNGF